MNQRMKWDAEAAFKRMNDKLRHHAVEPHEYIGGYTVPYTPPSNIGPERLAQLRKYEPPARPKPRDYDAILRAAKKAPVGYYEDAPRGIKFGGQPLPSAVTKPRGKDVDSADGPWPKWERDGDLVIRFDAPHTATEFRTNGRRKPIKLVKGEDAGYGEDPAFKCISETAALQWLEQNGHKDVAAQLRGKDATGGGRVWIGILGNDVASKRACVLIGGIGYCRVRGNWHYLGEQKGEPTGEKVELFGPEKDAILAECRKAMGI